MQMWLRNIIFIIGKKTEAIVEKANKEVLLA